MIMFPVFVTGVVDTGGELVSLTPVANLPMVSTIPALLVAKFAAGVIDSDGAPSIANTFVNF